MSGLSSPHLAGVLSVVGQMVGHFRILEEIGRGGMGVVYRAEDTHLGRAVALKMLPPDLTGDRDVCRRLAHEARAASSFTHPGIAAVYEFQEHPGGNFIVFEYVEGTTLRCWLNQHHFSIEEILEIGMQIADTLASAHDRGIVHRDLKPENIMLARGPEQMGRVKVLDFGVAKYRRPSAVATITDTQVLETMTNATAPGHVVGTLNYMSPEQVEGESVDSRSDLYALGLVLYELTTGVNPFVGKTILSTINSISNREPPSLMELNAVAPSELDRILRKCLRKRREERYQSARELLVDLSNLRKDLIPQAGLPSNTRNTAAPALPLSISRSTARGLFALFQIGYLTMYGAAFYKLPELLARLESEPAHRLKYLIIFSFICGPPLRLFLLTAIAFDYPDLGRKFRLLFPVVLATDLAWAASPLLLLDKLGGLTILASAALAFFPFSQRTVLYSAYSSRGGYSSSIRPRVSF